VGVLCGATLVAYTALTRDLSIWRRLYLVPGLAILLAVTSGWFVLVSQRNPGFLRFFFIHEHFQRFLTTVHKHGEPWWYFIPFAVFAVIPWLGQVTPALREAWSQRSQPAGFRPALFLLLWCAVVLVFFSASGSKLATYIMPCVPFLAVLLAPRIAASETAMPRAVYATGGLLLFAAAVIVVIAHRRSGDDFVPGQVALWCGVAAFAAVAGIVATIATRRRGPAGAVWKPLVACAAVGWSSLLMAYSATPPLRTAATLVRTVRGHIGPQTVLYSVGQYRPSLAPYLGRTLRVADYRGEFEGGLDSDSPSGLLTLEMFEQAWARESDAVAFLSHRTYADLAAKGIAGRVIARDDRSVVIERK
jgi:4-amino-4-deoxy-L-arabinose transferase-like glycosyltransferase